MVRVFLMIIPYHFDFFKGLFWFLVQNFASRGKPRNKTPSLLSMLWLKNPFPYSLEYVKDQRNRWGVSRKQFLSILKGATYFTYPAEVSLWKGTRVNSFTDSDDPIRSWRPVTTLVDPSSLTSQVNLPYRYKVHRSFLLRQATISLIISRTVLKIIKSYTLTSMYTLTKKLPKVVVRFVLKAFQTLLRTTILIKKVQCSKVQCKFNMQEITGTVLHIYRNWS